MSTQTPSRVVLLGNIPDGLPREQTFNLLNHVGHGIVVNLHLPCDQGTHRPLGRGFVEYSTTASAAAAVRNLNGHEIMGRKLRVEFESMGGVRENDVSATPSETQVHLPLQGTHHPLKRKRPQTSQQSIASHDSNPAGSSTPLTPSTVPRNKVTGTRASDKQEKPFKCPCGKKFTSFAGLRSHQKDTRRARPEKCRSTDEAEEAVGKPKKQSNLKAESKTKNPTCRCGRTFPNLGALQHHQADKANSGKCRPRGAIEPGRAFKSNSVTKTQPMNIMCGCGRKFATVASIEEHQQNNQESWTCHTWQSIGPVQTVQSGNSIRTDGSQGLYKPFQCACGRRFTTPLDIQYHQSQWSAFHSVKCREGITTFMGRPFDPNKETIGQAMAKLHPLQQLDAPSGQAQVHWTRRGTGQHLHTILVSSVQPADISVSSKDGYLVLGSYNWSSVGRSGDIYFVPGAAPVWQELSMPLQLPPDTDLPPTDSETAQDLPDYPYQASLEAINIMNPGWSFNDVDILTDWKALRALLILTAGKQGKAFRIKLYLVKDTLVIEMRTERAETWCNGNGDSVRHPSAQRRYGRSLEPTFTKWDTRLEKSEAHVRTIQYNLGSLSCVVRFQADTCYTHPNTGSTGPGGKDRDTSGPTVDLVDQEKVTTKQPAVKKQTENPALASEKNTTRSSKSIGRIPDKASSLGRTTTTGNNLAAAGPNIIIRGSGTPQEYVGEIRTKAHRKMGTAAPVSAGWTTQLWFTRIANLIVGEHSDGLVQHIQHHRLSSGGVWEQWEAQEKNQPALRKLVSLLSELKTLSAEYAASTGGHGAIFAVYDRDVGGPGLRMYESQEAREIPLPEKLIKSLWRVDEWGF